MSLILLTMCCPFAPPTYFTAPIVYFGAPIRGTVLDDATNEPIAGAVVAVQWRIVGPWGTRWPFVAKEAVTDERGEFLVRGWGPRLRPPSGGVMEDDPELAVFKSAYQPKVFFRIAGNNSFIRRSDADGRIIRLLPDREDPRERISTLRRVLSIGGAQPLLADELERESSRIPSDVSMGFFTDLRERAKKGHLR